MIFKPRGEYILTVILLVLSCFLVSCASIEKRTSKADTIAKKSNLKKEIVQTDNFKIVTYQKIKTSNEPLYVFIEGDGSAYLTKTRLSTNPTPKNPVALKLASNAKKSNVLYIARPYQYCEKITAVIDKSKFWSTHRYSEEVINDISSVIDEAKKKSGVKNIVLVGYSGGGAIAAIISAKRDDVIKLVTVCGNLDIDFHTSLHNVTPLTGSLNPVNFGDKLKNIKQVHFVGGKDKIVPRSVAEEYYKKISATSEMCQIIEIPENDHHTGWDEILK